MKNNSYIEANSDKYKISFGIFPVILLIAKFLDNKTINPQKEKIGYK